MTSSVCTGKAQNITTSSWIFQNPHWQLEAGRRVSCDVKGCFHYVPPLSNRTLYCKTQRANKQKQLQKVRIPSRRAAPAWCWVKALLRFFKAKHNYNRERLKTNPWAGVRWETRAALCCKWISAALFTSICLFKRQGCWKSTLSQSLHLGV